MADELNIPTHRWYQKRNHIALAKEDVSRQYIYDSGIQKIDAWINSQPWGNPIPSLFANDEPGVWYDPSDLSTLFQDTEGTTPVTTAGQTVGLVLDKSQGLTLGPELVTNGDFSDGSTGWGVNGEDATHVVTFADGKLQYQSDTTSPVLSFFQADALTAGVTYQVDVFVSSYTSGAIKSDQLGGTGFINKAGLNRVIFTSVGTGSLSFVRSTSDVDITIDNISVKELPGYHATQPTAAARPTYQTDGTLHWLSFDGVDDFMVAPTITPGIDKAQVFAGALSLTNNVGILSELSTSTTANEGSIALFRSNSNRYGLNSRGSALEITLQSPMNYSPPTTNVLTGLGDISGDRSTLRIDGTQVAQSTSDQGTGNYLAYPMYIGRRAGTSLPFDGHIYSLVTRFGANLETSTIETTEAYIAEKTGVTL